jgi:hypothetical protein
MYNNSTVNTAKQLRMIKNEKVFALSASPRMGGKKNH